MGIPQIPDEDKDKILNRIINGESFNKIAQSYGLHGQSVEYFLKKHRLLNHPAVEKSKLQYEKKGYSIDDFTKIFNEFRKGKSISILSRKYNISNGYIRNKFMELFPEEYKRIMSKE